MKTTHHLTKFLLSLGVLILLTSAICFAKKPKEPPISQMSGPVTVGTKGNEPLIASAPDGTIYISALQHLYRSTDQGATWTELPGPIYSSQLNLASDSSISIDPAGRLYFTFDYPYAGTTAVCTSDDRGDTWNCNPTVVPGGTDRMWVLAPTTTSAFEVTNEGLYETAFLQSSDGGSTWNARSLGAGLFEPQTGPLLQIPGSSDVLQITKIFGTLPTDIPELKVYVYHPDASGSLISDVRGTGLPLPLALPSASLGRDNELWVVTEETNATNGKQLLLAHSNNAGAIWTKLPPIPGTTSGTAVFSWVAAGAPGHVGVIYFHTTDNGEGGSLTTSNWSAMWAESFNALSATPTWNVQTLEANVHNGAICAAADCSGNNRYAGDFISAVFDKSDTAHLTWMKQEIDPTTNLATGAISIRYAKIVHTPEKHKKHKR